MFGKKLVIIAAAVALAMGHVAAHEQAAHIKVSVSSAKKHHAQQHKKHQPHHAPIKQAKHGKYVTKPLKHGKHAKQVSETASDAGEFDPSEFCLEGWSPMSVEGVEGVFCVYGQPCVDDIDGACPAPQQGLPYGGYCDKVETGVMGCKPVTEEMWWAANGEDDDGNTSGPVCGEGWSPMSVEGVEGVFCVEGQACVADIMGSCPGPQDDLEFGSYCGKVTTGVLGCKPYTEEQTPAEDDSDDSSEEDAAVCEEGSSPMSVEGVEGVFCVEGQACVADIMGSCPDAQDGLEFGSYCGTVKTGVLGCKPYTDETQTPEETGDVVVEVCEDGYSPMSVEGVEGIFCVEGQACVADIMGTCPEAQDGLEYGSYCGKVKTGVLGCKPYTDDSQTPEEGESEGDEIEVEIDVCEEGSSPMSVEGVEGVFCVSGQACAGVEGSCPGPQDGLEFGSHCGTVASGVLGCKPNDAPPATEDCTGEGESPMSVEGVEGVFCVTGQACAGVEGACPGPQDGLEFGAYCGKVASGVLGCKPNTSKAMLKIHQATHVAKKHHAKAHSAKTAKASLRAHAKAPAKKQQPKKHAHPSVKKVAVHH